MSYRTQQGHEDLCYGMCEQTAPSDMERGSLKLDHADTDMFLSVGVTCIARWRCLFKSTGLIPSGLFGESVSLQAVAALPQGTPVCTGDEYLG
jgi:hypothetical protein